MAHKQNINTEFQFPKKAENLKVCFVVNVKKSRCDLDLDRTIPNDEPIRNYLHNYNIINPLFFNYHVHRQTKTDSQTARQTHRHQDIHTDRQIDTKTYKHT